MTTFVSSGSLSKLVMLAFGASLAACVAPVDGDGESASQDEPIGETEQPLKLGVVMPSPWDVKATAVGAGDFFSCAREPSGSIACWGQNTSGQLGSGTVGGSRSNAGRVTGLASAGSVMTGSNHACAARAADGVVQCWGRSEHGQLGLPFEGNYPAPVTVPGLAGVTRVEGAGLAHSCAIAGGLVRCWGYDYQGALGDGEGAGPDQPMPTTAMGLTDVVETSASTFTTCARTSSGALWCWGSLYLPNATTSQATYLPRMIPLSEPAVSIAAGRSFVCAALQSGAVQCWGASSKGQTGTYSATPILAPVVVPGVSGAVEVSAGSEHACARLADGTMRCWGANAYGQLGNGTVAAWLPPVAVAGLGNVSTLSAGHLHTCAVSNGLAHCWGYNSVGQVGDGTTVTPRTTPRRVQFSQVVAQ